MKDDATFLALLKRSWEGDYLVATHLRLDGHEVWLNPLFVRPTVEQRAAYTDSGDLRARPPGAVAWQSHEVKWATDQAADAAFTSFGDYPERDVRVETVRAWDRKWPPPDVFWRVNAAGTHAAMIDCTTAEFWEQRSWTCYGDTQQWYYAPLETVEFITLRKG